MRDLRAFERTRLDDAPLISVVVCAYNAADTLEGCLRSLADLPYPRYEVVVVDDGSTDDTADIARRFGSVRLVEQGTNQGLSAARNRGAHEARGEIVAYLDADAEALPDWLCWSWRGMQALRADGVGGPNLPFPDAGLQERAVSGAPGVPVPAVDPDGTAEHLAGCNMVLRRDLVLDVGFEPALRTSSDDVRFCTQALASGARLAYHPRAAVLHHRRATIRGFLRQQRAYGLTIESEAGVEQMTWVPPSEPVHTPVASRLNPLKRRYVFTGAQEQGLYAQREYGVRTAFPLRVLTALGVAAAATLLPAALLGRLRAWAAGSAAALAATLAWVVASVPVYRPRRGTAFAQRLMTAALWLAQPVTHMRGRRAAEKD
jgi:O-antigen biosynthesis protein